MRGPIRHLLGFTDLAHDHVEQEAETTCNHALIADDQFAGQRGIGRRAFLLDQLLDDPVAHLLVVGRNFDEYGLNADV